MADVRPFRGVRYDLDRVGDAGRVVSPPYDVIDEALQTKLYDRHPHNIVRVIQGREEPGDGDRVNRYTRAGAAYRGWLAEGVLRRDREDGFYVYEQTFTRVTPEGTKQKRRTGLVGLVRIEPFGEGSVYPHEHTMPGPKADRLELMRHTEAAFGQIFSLYSDPEDRVGVLLAPHVASRPLFEFADDDGVTHRLWRVTDGTTLAAIAAFFEDRDLFIADGHHRYETSISYRHERRAKDGPGSWDFGMQTLVNMDDAEGMAINPIHRVVMELRAEDLTALAKDLGEWFELEERPFESLEATQRRLLDRAGEGRPAFGALLGGAERVRYLKLKPGVDVRALDDEAHSDAWRALDAGLLQVCLKQILNLDTETLIRGDKVRFVKVEAEVVRLVTESGDRAGFYLNPVTMDQLRAVVLAGERMPPKSTFFHPKVFAGLVMQDFRE